MPAPEGWMYYDDDLIKQLDKLWKKYGEAGDVVGARDRRERPVKDAMK
jgi:hypothetical protein